MNNKHSVMYHTYILTCCVYVWCYIGAIIGNQLGCVGHASGTSKDSEDCMLFASLFNVRPIIEEYSLEDAQKAYDAMDKGKAHFRGVIVPGK